MSDENVTYTKRTALVVGNTFSAFGKTYLPGAEIAPEDCVKWPDGTLERRMANGFIVSRVVESPVTPQTEGADLLAAAAKLKGSGKKE